MMFVKKIRNLFKIRLMWGSIPKVDIIIFDSYEENYLKKILSEYLIYFLSYRITKFHAGLLLKTIIRNKKIGLNFRFKLLYYNEFIRESGAKICITNQDTSLSFYELAKMLPDVHFVSCQEGLKTDWAESRVNDLIRNFDGAYFAFSQSYHDYLRNKSSKKYISGSIKSNSLYPTNNVIERICFISNYRERSLDVTLYDNVRYGEMSVLQSYLLVRIVGDFCKNNNIKFVIASKSSRERDLDERSRIYELEKKYYYNILGYEPNIIRDDSYKVVSTSKLSVCDHSALGYEVLGRGGRVVFINVFAYFHRKDSHKFGWPLIFDEYGPFWTNIYDQEYIKQMLHSVYNISDKEWYDLILPYQDKIMKVDYGNTILHGHIEDVLHKSSK